MAALLYRLGRFTFRRRWLVAATWLAVLVAALVGSATLSGQTSDSFSIPGTPSQRAIDLLQERFPEVAADGATARVVFGAPEGETLDDPRHRAVIDDTVAALTRAPLVTAVSSPFTSNAVNQSGTVAFAQVTLRVPPPAVTEDAREALVSALDVARSSGLTVEVGGEAVQAQPEQGLGEILGVFVAAIVLFITLGSLVTAGLPLLTAILGIGIGVSVISIATGFIELSSTTSTLALMLGLAVAIDYALFIVSRYRHEIGEGHDREEAAGRAVGTAGSAVVFAGLTVMIALAALSVVNLPMMTQMGLAAAFTVAVAVLIALTLLPALLGVAGKRIGSGRKPSKTNVAGQTARTAVGARWARLIARRPVVVLLVAVVGLGVVAIPTLDLRLGMPDDSNASPTSTQRKAYDLLADGFGAGFNGPLTVVVDAEVGSIQAEAAQATERIQALDNVAAVSPALVNEAGDTAILNVVPVSGPSTAETEELVHRVRELDTGTPATTIEVTGPTAINLDFSEKVGDALLPYLAVVVGLALILLVLVFRSLLVPIKATLGFLLSIGATFGVVVAVFQWGWAADLLGIDQTGPIISFLPIFLIGTVFGLAMDYQLFLVTRMREEFVHGAEPTDAVVTGFTHGARVVTAAAIIMISVFSGFVLSPEAVIKSMGFALGIAVLFDAIVVRMTIVPAVMTLLGRRAWWLPRWLDRVLPKVDVEGEALRQLLTDRTADGAAVKTLTTVGATHQSVVAVSGPRSSAAPSSGEPTPESEPGQR
ncbi:MMPL family transporter [Micromonospora sp. NPDC003241]